MTDEENLAFHQQYGGCYVVRRGSEVIASAATYGELDQQFEHLDVDWGEAIIEYVRRPDVVYIGSPWKVVLTEIP